MVTMSLVTYHSDTDDDDDLASETAACNHTESTPLDGAKRKRLSSAEDEPRRPPRPPPLPSSLTTLYASNVRSSTNDNPDLHEGRKRQIPHVEGNWPSFVYLEWLPSQVQFARLEELIADINENCIDNDQVTVSETLASTSRDQQQQVRSSLRSDLGVRLPLHVSLSAPLILITDNKDMFEKRLSENVKELNLTTFTTSPSDMKWVSNHEDTRHFLILTLKRPRHDELRSLLSACNRTAAGFGLPQLYTHNENAVGVPAGHVSNGHKKMLRSCGATDDDKFHISIAWSLRKPPTSLSLLAQLHKQIGNLDITFEKVFIKIGNQVSTVLLEEAPSQGREP